MSESNGRLGEILLDAGIIDAAQLDRALSYQKAYGGRLGTSFIKLGYLSEQDLLKCLARQLKLPRLDLRHIHIPDEVLKTVSSQKALKYNILPVARREMHGTVYLIVAMTDPTNLMLIDDLQFMTGCRVRPALAAEEEITKAIHKFYHIRQDIDHRCASTEDDEGLCDAVAEAQERARQLEEMLQRLVETLRAKDILNDWDCTKIQG